MINYVKMRENGAVFGKNKFIHEPTDRRKQEKKS